MRKKTRCLWCAQYEARSKRIVLNRDGSKNFSDPWLYASFFLALGITVTTRVPPQWQEPVATLFIVIGTLVITWLIIWRSRLPPGVEYRCSFCGFRWYDDAPVEKKGASPNQNG